MVRETVKPGVRAVAIAATVLAVVLLTGGCGSSKKHAVKPPAASTAASTTQTTSPASTPATTAPPRKRKPPQVAVMTSQFGRVLNAPGGHALYVFTRDNPGQGSTCYGKCAKTRPPFLVRETPQARDAVKQRLLGTSRRRDGRLQATYAGRPLYFYLQERDPGEVLSQGVSQFGGTWWVVAPGGKPVEHH